MSHMHVLGNIGRWKINKYIFLFFCFVARAFKNHVFDRILQEALFDVKIDKSGWLLQTTFSKLHKLDPFYHVFGVFFQSVRDFLS